MNKLVIVLIMFMNNINNKGNLFFIFLFVVFICSVALTYYRYIVLEDFTYFLTEENYPNKFDLSTYPI